MIFSTIWFLISSALLHTCGASRILALFPYPLKSHFIVFEALLLELAKRGHDVTVITPFPQPHNITNYHQTDASYCLQIPSYLFELEYAASHYKSAFHLVSDLVIVTKLHEPLLTCKPMLELKHTKDKYDLLITETFATDVLLPYAHILQTPFILFSTLPILPWMSDRVGNIDHPGYIPFAFSDFPLTKNSKFFERLYNTAIYVVARAYHKLQWEPLTNELVRKYFGPAMPPVQEIAKNTSMILSFSHFSINSPRPLVPNVIEAGGIHIKDPSPLPKVSSLGIQIIKCMQGVSSKYELLHSTCRTTYATLVYESLPILLA